MSHSPWLGAITRSMRVLRRVAQVLRAFFGIRAPVLPLRLERHVKA